MADRAWQLVARSPIVLSLAQWAGLLPRFVPWETTWYPAAGVDGAQRSGYTVWGVRASPWVAAIGLDWCEVRPNIVAQSAPMGLVSNVVLLNDDGIAIEHSARMMHLNLAVHGLAWQKEVMSVIGRVVCHGAPRAWRCHVASGQGGVAIRVHEHDDKSPATVDAATR